MVLFLNHENKLTEKLSDLCATKVTLWMQRWEFFLPLPLITSLFLSDLSVTDISLPASAFVHLGLC